MRKRFDLETSFVRMGIRRWPRVECVVTSVRGVVVIAHGGQRGEHRSHHRGAAGRAADDPGRRRDRPRGARPRGGDPPAEVRGPRLERRAGLAGPRPERAAGRHPRRVRAGSRGPGRALDGSARRAARGRASLRGRRSGPGALASARRAGRSARRTEHPARTRDRGPRHQPGRYVGLRRPGPGPDRGRRDRGTRRRARDAPPGGALALPRGRVHRRVVRPAAARRPGRPVPWPARSAPSSDVRQCPRRQVRSWPQAGSSSLQGGADQRGQLVVAQLRRVVRPDPDRALAGLQGRMAGREAAVAP